MKVTEFFNPYNEDHLAAYIHCSNVGSWPEDFFPVDIEFDSCHQIVIACKMALVLARLGCDGQILGMPTYEGTLDINSANKT